MGVFPLANPHGMEILRGDVFFSLLAAVLTPKIVGVFPLASPIGHIMQGMLLCVYGVHTISNQDCIYKHPVCWLSEIPAPTHGRS